MQTENVTWQGENILAPIVEDSLETLPYYNVFTPSLRLVKLTETNASQIPYLHTGHHIDLVRCILVPMLWLLLEDLKNNPQCSIILKIVLEKVDQFIKFNTEITSCLIVKEILISLFL